MLIFEIESNHKQREEEVIDLKETSIINSACIQQSNYNKF